jgi:WD40 repeat protein
MYFILTNGMYFILTNGMYFILTNGMYFILANGMYFILTNGMYFILTNGMYFILANIYIIMSYKNKYLKYKNKYLYLKKQKGGANATVNNITTTKCLRTLVGHSSYVNSVAHFVRQDGNGEFIVSGSVDRTIKIWGPDGRCLHTLSGHTNSVTSLAVYGNNIVSGSLDHTIKIWGPHPQQQELYTCIRTLGVSGNQNSNLGHAGWVLSLAHFVRQEDNRDCIVSGSNDHTIKIWNPNDGTCLHTLGINGNEIKRLGHTSSVLSVAHLVTQPDNRHRIISGSADRTIKIWEPNDVGEYTCVQTLGVNNNYDYELGHTGSVKSVSVYRNRIVSCSTDHTIKIWEPEHQQPDTYRCVHTLGVINNENPELGHTSWVNSVTVYGDRIVSGSNDSTIKIWGPNYTGLYTCLHTFGVNNNNNPELGHTRRVESVIQYKTLDNPNSYIIVSCSNDHTIKIWYTNIDKLCNLYRTEYEQLLYPNYEATIPQHLIPFCPELQNVLDDVHLKCKLLFPLHLLFHKFVHLNIDYSIDLIESLLQESDNFKLIV